MLRLFVFSVLVFLCLAETPVSGPYPPSGWKPKGVPFTLPTQFLPSQQQRAGAATDIEVTQERVEYVGQLSETTTNIPEPNVSYLPAGEEPEEELETEPTSTENFLKVQGLPSRNNAPQFNNNEQNRNGQFRLNTGEFVGQQKNLQNGQLRQQQQQQQQFNNQQQHQQFNNQQQQFINQQQQQQQQPQANFGRQVLPANQYGAPSNLVQGNQSESKDETESTNQKNDNSNVEVDTDDAENNDDQTNVPGVTNPVNSNGQYYILTPDNTLQRVIFMTSQNPEEALTNAFTAQLRYMPVEPIRDPIYSYNAEGQLIRIFKK